MSHPIKHNSSEETIRAFEGALNSGGYAWPGGYPLYFIMADCGSLSFEAAQSEKDLIIQSIKDTADGYDDKQWLPIAIEINYEDSSLFCSHTNKRIESAYAEDDANNQI